MSVNKYSYSIEVEGNGDAKEPYKKAIKLSREVIELLRADTPYCEKYKHSPNLLEINTKNMCMMKYTTK